MSKLEEIIKKLLEEGGAIVAASACSVDEIRIARAAGRLVDDALVLRPAAWLEAVRSDKDALVAHRSALVACKKQGHEEPGHWLIVPRCMLACGGYPPTVKALTGIRLDGFKEYAPGLFSTSAPDGGAAALRALGVSILADVNWHGPQPRVLADVPDAAPAAC